MNRIAVIVDVAACLTELGIESSREEDDTIKAGNLRFHFMSETVVITHGKISVAIPYSGISEIAVVPWIDKTIMFHRNGEYTAIDFTEQWRF